MSTIQNGLESMGLKTTELSTQELIELFYEIYNPITSRNQKIEKIEEMAIEKDQTSV